MLITKLLIGEAFGTMSDYEKVYKNVKHSLGVHLGELAMESGVALIIPFHMHPRYGSDRRKKKEMISEIRKNYKENIIWPHDLLTIVI